MAGAARHKALGAVAALSLAACAPGLPVDGQDSSPEYKDIETVLLDDDIVNIRVAMAGGRGRADVAAYARCAAAQYALIRGYGFARHVRTNVTFQAGIWRADAVYTISSTLPAGLRTIDAEVTVRDCAAQGIPTV